MKLQMKLQNRIRRLTLLSPFELVEMLWSLRRRLATGGATSFRPLREGWHDVRLCATLPKARM
jgi:hypothetical protein